MPVNKKMHLHAYQVGLIISVLVLGCLLLGACNLPSAVTVVPGTTPQPSLTPEPVSSPEPKVESVFGPGTFSLTLPTGWDVFGPEKVNSDANRPYDIYLLGEDPTGSDGPGTSKVIVARAAEWSAEELALAQCSTCPVNPFEAVTLGGRDALRTQVGGGGVPFMITWYFVENQGNLIGICIHDPETLAPLEAVLSSIQFE